MNLLQLAQNRKNVVVVTAAASFLGAILYKVCKTFGSMTLSVVITVIFAALSAVVAFVQKPRKKYLANHRSGPLSLLGVLAPLILIACGIVECMDKKYLMAVTAFADAAVLLAFVVFAIRRKTPNQIFSALLTVFNLIRLIVGYRTWSVVPRIADYMYLLFAGIIIMLVSFYLLMFSLDDGSRRFCTFLEMFGTYCCLCAALFGGAANCLFFFAWAVFLLGELSALMTSSKKRRVLKQSAAEYGDGSGIPEDGHVQPQIPLERPAPMDLEELLDGYSKIGPRD